MDYFLLSKFCNSFSGLMAPPGKKGGKTWKIFFALPLPAVTGRGISRFTTLLDSLHKIRQKSVRVRVSCTIRVVGGKKAEVKIEGYRVETESKTQWVSVIATLFGLGKSGAVTESCTEQNCHFEPKIVS